MEGTLVCPSLVLEEAGVLNKQHLDTFHLADWHAVEPILESNVPFLLAAGDIALPTIADLGDGGLGETLGVKEGIDELIAVGVWTCRNGKGVHAVGLIEGHAGRAPCVQALAEPVIRYS